MKNLKFMHCELIFCQILLNFILLMHYYLLLIGYLTPLYKTSKALIGDDCIIVYSKVK